ncbi:MAG: RnfABCDGE type electron transport complex subunit B [Spirochaetaceae bacterium]|jgi:Na+-translocating ferredoxin:NAD+ oxidoreductase RNF subunit RnfB|nr:RnfABCDGE type electron transport complex subunit B [Spirochaetaceae bacterium]
MSVIITTLIVSFIAALALGFLLGVFRKIFHVDENPLVSEIRDVLPGTNCGACGYPGCDGYAAAVACGSAPSNLCSVGGFAVASKVGALAGQNVSAENRLAVLACQGTCELAPPKGEYNGVQTCRAARVSTGGTKLCNWGCLGFGDCEKVCPFDAIHVGPDCIPHVDYAKCTGCGICVKECPQGLLLLQSSQRKGAVALCSNRSPVKSAVLKTCKIGCIKCGKCEKVCPEGAIKVINGIPEVDYSLCTSCGKCVTDCPTRVLKLLENGVFDAAAGS